MFVKVTRNYYDKRLKSSMELGRVFEADDMRAGELIAAGVAEEVIPQDDRADNAEASVTEEPAKQDAVTPEDKPSTKNTNKPKPSGKKKG